VLQSLEQSRKNGELKANLEGQVTLTLSPQDHTLAKLFDLTEVTIVSHIDYIEIETKGTPIVSISKSAKKKCARCWRHDDLTPENHATPGLCPRCASVIQESV
jgi:isoleucyl-tRNA synthetase